MQKLNETCTHLSRLEISYADLSSISVYDLSPGLRRLSLARCEIPVKWFQCSSAVDAVVSFSLLTDLNLSGSSRVCKSHLEDLDSLLPQLKVLSLAKCYRIDDKAMEAFVKLSYSQAVEELNLDETVISDKSLELICSPHSSFMPSLKLIYARKCKLVSVDFKLKRELGLVSLILD